MISMQCNMTVTPSEYSGIMLSMLIQILKAVLYLGLIIAFFALLFYIFGVLISEKGEVFALVGSLAALILFSNIASKTFLFIWKLGKKI